jgi:hypothetical protein
MNKILTTGGAGFITRGLSWSQCHSLKDRIGRIVDWPGDNQGRFAGLFDTGISGN